LASITWSPNFACSYGRNLDLIDNAGGLCSVSIDVLDLANNEGELFFTLISSAAGITTKAYNFNATSFGGVQAGYMCVYDSKFLVSLPASSLFDR